jgi:Mg/Co/Ni transporter MgtE
MVDADGTMIGVLSVDDLVERMLPAAWRRRYGLAGD